MRRSVSGFCHVELHSIMWLEVFWGNIKVDRNELCNHVSLTGPVHSVELHQGVFAEFCRNVGLSCSVCMRSIGPCWFACI